MIIFINDNRRNGEFKFKKKKGEGMQMTIPSVVTSKEYRFRFDCIESIKGVYGDIEIHGYTVYNEGDLFICNKLKNNYKDNETERIYAILNALSISDGELFIPEEMKSKINICEMVENLDERHLMSKKYIISFEISKNEKFTIYKGTKQCKVLREEITFEWDDLKEQFCCKTTKPKKPYAKNLISLSKVKC